MPPIPLTADWACTVAGAQYIPATTSVHCAIHRPIDDTPFCLLGIMLDDLGYPQKMYATMIATITPTASANNPSATACRVLRTPTEPKYNAKMKNVVSVAP